MIEQMGQDATSGRAESDEQTVRDRIADILSCVYQQPVRERALLYSQLTYALYWAGHDEEALPIYDAFFQGQTEGVSAPTIARMYARRGAVLTRLGRSREGIEQYLLATYSIPDLPDSERYWPLYMAASNFKNLHDFRQANRYLITSDSLLQHLVRQDSARYNSFLAIIRAERADVILRASSRTRDAMKRAAAEAAPFIVDAQRRQSANTAPRQQVQTMNIQARRQRWEGDFEGALRTLGDALRLMEDYPSAMSGQYRASMENGAGWSLFALQRYEEAGRAFQRSYEAAVDAKWTPGIMSALLDLGFVAEAQGTPDGLRDAEQLIREATVYAEVEREALGLSEWSAASRELTRTPYLALIRVLVKQGRVQDALMVFDEMQARYLRDLRSAATQTRDLPPMVRTRLDSLTTLLHNARLQHSEPSLPLEERMALQATISRLQREREALAGGSNNYRPLSIARLQESLAERGQTLLVYAFAEEYAVAPGSGYALGFVVRPDTLIAKMLPTTELRVTQTIDSLTVGWDEAQPALDLTHLHRLYTELVAPLEPFLRTAEALTIVPSGPLARIPFGLLIQHPPPHRYAYRESDYLLRRHPITTEIALSLITDDLSIPSTSYDMLALGRSQYGGMMLQTAGNEERLADLPNVRDEVNSLRRLFQDGLFAIDSAATEDYFRTHLADARIVHLAGHALVNPDQPMYSQVVLSASQRHDGALYLYELQDAALEADLVTLSGCSTARGNDSPSDGLLGLQFAFRAAGAGATVSTLWQVDDAATVDLMERFYGNLARGLPKDQALQQAQLAYLEAHEGLEASPFFWGAPVLYGNPAPIQFKHLGWPRSFWLALGLALLLVGIATPRLAKRYRGAVRVPTA